MRVVADTNIVVSGLLWHGPPRQVLDRARRGEIHLFTSIELLEELEDVLQRKKFSRRLRLASVSPDYLVFGYANLTQLVRPATIEPVVLEDPDDDAVLACALAAQAQAIVSGDSHLLDLRRHREVSIYTAQQLLDLLTPSTSM